MKYLIAAAAIAAFTVPAFAGEDTPGRNNPHLHAAQAAAASTSPAAAAVDRVGPMAGDYPGKRNPNLVMHGMASDISSASIGAGTNRAAIGWHNDDRPGDRHPAR